MTEQLIPPGRCVARVEDLPDDAEPGSRRWIHLGDNTYRKFLRDNDGGWLDQGVETWCTMNKMLKDITQRQEETVNRILQAVKKRAWEAYLAGFKVSGQGSNYEYPYCDERRKPEDDPEFVQGFERWWKEHSDG